MVEFVETPEVCLTLDGQNWVAQFKGSIGSTEGVTYAFYLLRNGVRVAHRWYEKGLTAKFVNDGVAGRYQARVFIKRAATESADASTKTLDSERVVQNGLPYDLRRWGQRPLFERDLGASWGEEAFVDGLYHFTEGESHIDLLLSGMDKLLTSPAVLVCCSGGSYLSRRYFGSIFLWCRNCEKTWCSSDISFGSYIVPITSPLFRLVCGP